MLSAKRDQHERRFSDAGPVRCLESIAKGFSETVTIEAPDFGG